MLKRIFQLFILLSIVFLVFYLAKFDYLVFSEIRFNYFYLSLSVMFLWLGFYLSTFSWYKALQIHDIKVPLKPVIYSHGIAVFAKYIPGKLWVILGRAAFIARLKSNLKTTSTISLKEQLIYILLGLLISLVPFLILDFAIYFKAGLILIILGLIIFLFSVKFHEISIGIINRLIKKEINVPVLNIKKALKLSKYIVLYWLVWIIAFYFFCKSINSETLIIDALSFPLSVSFGVLALIAPGGIGIREGIIATYLISTGWDNDLAITTSLISRIWFFTGELFIFVFSVFIKMSRYED